MWLYTQFCDLISFLVFFIKNIRYFCLHILFIALIVVLVAYFDIYGKDVLFGVFISIGAAVIFESYRFYKKSKVSEPLLKQVYNEYQAIIDSMFIIERENMAKLICETNNIEKVNNEKISIDFLENKGIKLVDLFKILSLAEKSLNNIVERHDKLAFSNSSYKSTFEVLPSLFNTLKSNLAPFFNNNIVLLNSLENDFEKLSLMAEIRSLLEIDFYKVSIEFWDYKNAFAHIKKIIALLIKTSDEAYVFNEKGVIK